MPSQITRICQMLYELKVKYFEMAKYAYTPYTHIICSLTITIISYFLTLTFTILTQLTIKHTK